MKKLIWMGLLIASFCWASESLDRIVAVVNDEVITQSQLQQAVHAATSAGEANTTQSQEKLLQSMIDERLQLQFAKSVGITVSDKDVNRAIAGIASENHLSVPQMISAMQSQGTSLQQYKQRIREQILMAQIQQSVLGPRISVSDEEAAGALSALKRTQANESSEYHLQDILISVKEGANAEEIQQKETQARNMLTALQKEGHFENYPSTDLDWRLPNDLPILFGEPVKTMKVGETIGPIHAANGFHLLHLVGKRAHQMQITQRALRDEARKMVYKEKFIKASQAWIQQLRAQAYIQVKL